MVATVFLTATGAAAQPAGPAKALRIGYIDSFTGWHSPLGLVERPDLENMTNIINERGGVTVKGQKYNIEIVAEDTKSGLDGTAAAATKLAYDQKVKFVIGPGGPFASAVTPILTPNKILNVIAFTNMMPPTMGPSAPYTFLAHNSSVGMFIAGLKAMKKEFPNVRKVAIVMPDDGSQRYLLPPVKRAMERQGIIMIGSEVAYPNEMLDMSPIAAKLNAIKDIDGFIHESGLAQSAANIMKALRELGNAKPYIVSTPADGNDIAAVAGKAGATNALCTNVFPNAPGNPPLLNELVKRRPNQKVPLNVRGATSLYTLVNIIKAADSIDPVVVKAKWESMDKVDTLFGTGIISGDETYGIKHHAIGTPFAYEMMMDGKVTFGGWVDVGAIP
jgi:ABC-type branched-subunit amino acid transport system substrate-binding protein